MPTFGHEYYLNFLSVCWLYFWTRRILLATEFTGGTQEGGRWRVVGGMWRVFRDKLNLRTTYYQPIATHPP